MLHLTLAGLSEDGKRLLLVSDSGERVHPRRRRTSPGRAARRARTPRPVGDHDGQHAASPRHPGAHPGRRVAGGGGPGRPDLGRQDHAVRGPGAGRARPRRRARPALVGTPQGRRGRRARTLGDAVASHLRALNVDPDGVDWDAWRREDGRWALTAAYVSPKRKGTAAFTYDAPGNYVVTENDDARWLVGEAVAGPPAEPAARDDLKRARQRRLSAVPEEELPLGDDALELVSEPETSTVDLTETAARVRDGSDADLSPTPEPLADEPHPDEPHPDEAAPAAEEQTEPRSPRPGAAAGTAQAQGPRPRLGAELGRDHVRRQAGLTRSGLTGASGSDYPPGHVVLRHRRHRLHRPLPRRGAARPPRGRRPRPGARGVAPPAAAADRALAAPRHPGRR